MAIPAALPPCKSIQDDELIKIWCAGIKVAEARALLETVSTRFSVFPPGDERELVSSETNI